MSRRIELVGSGPRGRAKVRLMDSDIEREGSWRERSGCRGWVKMKAGDWLWPSMKAPSERKGKTVAVDVRSG